MTLELKQLILNCEPPLDKDYQTIKFYTSDGECFELEFAKLEETKRRISNELNVKNDIMTIIGE